MGTAAVTLGQCFSNSSVHIHHMEGLLNHIAGPYSRVSDLVPGPQIVHFSVPNDTNTDGDPSITLVTLLKVIASALSFFCNSLQDLSQFLKIKIFFKNCVSVYIYREVA